METIWLTLALRAAITALIVIAAAMVAERAGPLLGGLVATLPVSAGPAYVMLAFDHPAEFIADAALGSMAANVATVLFIVVFVLLVPARGLARALASALGAWLVAILAIRAVAWSAALATLANLGAHAAGVLFTRRAVTGTGAPVRRTPRTWHDLPLRGLMVGLLVAIVVTTSDALGPFATGIGAVAPVTYTSLVLVVTPRQGRVAAAAIMASALRGFAGFSLGLLVLHLLAVPLGSAMAMLACLAVMLAWSGAVLLARRRRA